MIVGIYIEYLEAGGVTTSSYEQSILEAVKSSETKHEFYVFTNSKISETGYATDKKLKYICIGDFDNFVTNKIILKFLLLVTKLFFKIIKLPDLRKKIIYNLEVSSINKALHKYNIRLFWQPFGLETIDIPYIQTCYDCNDRVHPYLPEFAPDATTWIDYNYFRTNLFQRASYIIVGTEELKRQVVHYYAVSEERVKTIPLFVPEISNVKTYMKTDSFELKSLPPRYLFFPARLIPQKNHIVILLALEILKREYNLNVSVVFTGLDKGNKDYIFQKIKELQLEENIHYLGVVSFNDLTYLYSNAFALVFVPFNGPDNLPPLEAFSLGCPVIASKVSGAEEQMGDAALLFESTDEHALANHILSLYSDEKLRRDLIDKGYKRADGNNAERYVSNVIKIVDEFSLKSRAWGETSYNILPNLSSK